MRRILAASLSLLLLASAGRAHAQAFSSQISGIRFVAPRGLVEFNVQEMGTPQTDSPAGLADAVLAETCRDVLRAPEARLLAVYAAEGAHMVAADYATVFPLDNRPRLEEETLSAFALTDQLVGTLADSESSRGMDVATRGGRGVMLARDIEIPSAAFSIWTVLVPHEKGTLVLRFGAVTASDEVSWVDFEDEVAHSINTIAVDQHTSHTARWVIIALAIGAAGLLATRLKQAVEVREEAEEEEEYEAELEKAFGKAFPGVTAHITPSAPLPANVTAEFKFPPRIQHVLEAQDIYAALDLAEQLLKLAHDMHDPRAEATYRECIVRIRALAATEG